MFSLDPRVFFQLQCFRAEYSAARGRFSTFLIDNVEKGMYAHEIQG